MKAYDIAIIGNGIIGTLLAYKIRENSKKKIVLVGPKNRIGSASKASGAMLNVFSEIDNDKFIDDYMERKIQIGIKSFKYWDKFLKHIDKKKEILTADDMVLFKSEKSTELEKDCFESIKKYSKKYKYYDDSNNKLEEMNKAINFNKKLSFFMLKGEGAVNSKKLFNYLDEEILKSKIEVCHNKVLNIKQDLNNANFYVEMNNNERNFECEKILLCAGSFSKSILDIPGLNILDLYYGGGSAFEITDRGYIPKNFPKRTVLRSPNRGSACGLHILPREINQYYLGAGSNITHKPNYNHRLGTLSYLLNCFENVFGNATHIQCNPVLGFRPISFDGKPMIGIAKKNLFIASGTKRDGFTLSPVIVEYIEKWIANGNYKDKDFNGWEPTRKPISFGNREFATNAYIKNKIAGLLEHGDIVTKDIKRVSGELKDQSNRFHDKIIKLKKLSQDFAVHPEILNTFK